jgi:hypothetical protein
VELIEAREMDSCLFLHLDILWDSDCSANVSHLLIIPQGGSDGHPVPKAVWKLKG